MEAKSKDRELGQALCASVKHHAAWLRAAKAGGRVQDEALHAVQGLGCSCAACSEYRALGIRSKTGYIGTIQPVSVAGTKLREAGSVKVDVPSRGGWPFGAAGEANYPE